MEKIPSVSLDKVIDSLTVEQLGSHCLPAKVHLGTATLCRSVSGGLYRMSFSHHMWPRNRPSQASESFSIITARCWCYFAQNSTQSPRIPRNAVIKFTHGDLLPKNIIVEGSRITGILEILSCILGVLPDARSVFYDAGSRTGACRSVAPD